MAERMKDSGIDGVGLIPESWDESRRIKDIFVLSKGLSITKENLIDEGLSVISYGQVHSKDNMGTYIKDSLIRYVDYKYRKDKVSMVTKGDFIFADTSEDLDGCGNCVYVDRADEMFAGYHTITFHSESSDNRYLAYLFTTDAWRTQIRKNVYAVKVYTVSQKILKECKIILPSKEERQAIADFLDKRCAQIDDVIADLEEQIELLKQYKTSIISECVTKGLDRSVQYKNSNNEWIGDVPTNWDVQRVLYLLKMSITDGPHTTPEMQDEGVPFVSAEAVSCGNGKIDFEHIWGYISEDFYKECCKKYVPQVDDIYMIKSGATTGRVSIVDTIEPKFTIWSPLAVFRCNKEKMLPRFMFYSLQADFFQMQVQLGWTYGTQQNIGMRTLEHLKVCVPPIEEQIIIVNHLDKVVGMVDDAINQKEMAKQKITNHKLSTIYEYVTGKKRVKEVDAYAN